MADLKNDASEYRLNSNELDTLRQELQTATLEQLKEFNKVVVLAHELFLKKFTHLFPKKAIIPTERLKRTFLLTDEETFKAFQETMDLPEYFDKEKAEKIRKRLSKEIYKYFGEKNIQENEITSEMMWEWLSQQSENERRKIEQVAGIDTVVQQHTYLGEDETALFRAYINKGRFVIGMAKEYWDELPEETKEAFRKLTDNEKEARELSNEAHWLKQTLHELTHLYQKGDADKNVPLWLAELQATWASQELVPDVVKLTNDIDTKRAAFFQELVDIYGDEVHKLIFHTQTDTKPEILDAIKKKFTPEVQKELYPNYRVITSTL